MSNSIAKSDYSTFLLFVSRYLFWLVAIVRKKDLRLWSFGPKNCIFCNNFANQYNLAEFVKANNQSDLQYNSPILLMTQRTWHARAGGAAERQRSAAAAGDVLCLDHFLGHCLRNAAVTAQRLATISPSCNSTIPNEDEPRNNIGKHFDNKTPSWDVN